MKRDWKINPEWPADCTGIVGYFAFDPGPTSQRILIEVDDWRFFAGCGNTQHSDVLEFSNDVALLVASGCPYIVNARTQKVMVPNPVCDSIDMTVLAKDYDIVVARGRWFHVWGFDPQGLRWTYSDIVLDDLRRFEQRGSEFIVETYDDGMQGLYKVRLDLETGLVVSSKFI